MLDSCKINPSLGGLALAPPLDAGITYLSLYIVSLAALVSDFLLINDLGVDSPIAVTPNPIQTSSYIALSVAATDTFIYH